MKSNNLRSLATVIKFTMRDFVGRKSFRISTIIIMAMIVFGFNVPRIMENLAGDEPTDAIILSDPENVYNGALEILVAAGEEQNTNNNFPAPKFKISTQNLDTIKDKVDKGDAPFAILISRGENDSIKLNFIIINAQLSALDPSPYVQLLSNLYTNVQISKLGFTPAQIAQISPQFDFAFKQIDNQEIGSSGVMAMTVCILLFFAIYFCAFQVSASITTEKTSKIMETLVTSTSPRTIVLGKTFGIGLVGLAQITLFAATAFFSAHAFLDAELLEKFLDLSNFTPYFAVITLVYFILGYFAYALLYALTGSTISKPDDIQSANMPVGLIATVGFYLADLTLMNPIGELNAIAALLPISSPFCMPIRVMMNVASVWEILLSITILIVTCIVIAHVAIKIYSSAILNYGTKMSFKDIIKSYREK